MVPHRAHTLLTRRHTYALHTHTRTPHTSAPPSVHPPPSISTSLSLALFFSPSPCACLPTYFPFLILLYLPRCLSPSLYLWVSQSLILCFSLTFSLSLSLLVSPFLHFFFRGIFNLIFLYAKGNITFSRISGQLSLGPACLGTNPRPGFTSGCMTFPNFSNWE